MSDQTITHLCSDPKPELRIKVEKGQRNTYAWEISASTLGTDVDRVLAVIDRADKELWQRYGPTDEAARVA